MDLTNSRKLEHIKMYLIPWKQWQDIPTTIGKIYQTVKFMLVNTVLFIFTAIVNLPRKMDLIWAFSQKSLILGANL